MANKKNVSEVMGEIKEEQNKRLNDELEKKREEQLKEQQEKEAAKEIGKMEEELEEEPYEEDEDEIKAKKRLEREKRRDIRRSKWIEVEPTVTKVLRKVIVGVAIVGAITVAILYNTPGKRFARNIKQADELSLQGNFADAIVKYKKALSINNNSIETHLGILCAKEAAGDEDLQAVFNETLNMFLNFDDVTLEENRALITEYVLHESTIFSGNTEERLNALEKGYELTAGSEDIRRLITECVNELVTKDRNEGNFEDAIKLLERFDKKTDIDDEEIIASINKEQSTYELKKALLSKVYEALKDYEEALLNNKEPDPFTYNFTKIMEIDGSEEANSLAGSKASDKYVYVPSENYNAGSGVGAGLYTYSIEYETVEGDVVTAYSFYVGEYKDGLRDGKGIMFTRTGEYSFVMYAGTFKEDTPNGTGTRYVKEDDGANYVFTKYSGNWENNLAEGKIDVTEKNSEYMGVTFSGSVNVSHGKGEVVPTESEEYVVQNLRSENLIGVLESDTEGYALMLAFWQRANDVLSATGIKGEK